MSSLNPVLIAGLLQRPQPRRALLSAIATFPNDSNAPQTGLRALAAVMEQ